jgi:hypothetical protein
MASLMDLTKFVVARIYPVLVWGALMGLVVHAGIRSQFSPIEADAESASLIENASANSVPARVYSERLGVDKDIPDRAALP